MFLSRYGSILLLMVFTAGLAAAQFDPELVYFKKIWDQGEHNAFTDLIRFNDVWYCAFREASGHVKGNGGIRIIAFVDGEDWESRSLLLEEGVDLRDPKICFTPNGVHVACLPTSFNWRV